MRQGDSVVVVEDTRDDHEFSDHRVVARGEFGYVIGWRGTTHVCVALEGGSVVLPVRAVRVRNVAKTRRKR